MTHSGDMTAWGLAGFLDDQGRFNWGGNPVSLFCQQPLEVKQQGLTWNGRDFVKVPATEIVLQQFLELGNVSVTDEQILAFARSWGVLGICKHALPASHAGKCSPYRTKAGYYWEPFIAWRVYAREAQTIMRIAAEITVGRLGNSEDWKILNPKLDPQFRSKLASCGFVSGIEAAKRYLVNQLDQRWLGHGDVRPGIFWTDDGGWRVSIHPRGIYGLFGFLALQLVLAISQVGMAICAECSNVYRATRSIRYDRENFCPQCGLRASQRRASKRYRDKERNCKDRLDQP